MTTWRRPCRSGRWPSHEAFYFAAGCCVVAAWLRGGKYFYADAPAPAPPVAETPEAVRAA